MAASQLHYEATTSNTQPKIPEPASKIRTSNETSNIPGTSTFLSERAQLEKERLERQKRSRPLPAQNPTVEDESEGEEPPAKRHQVYPPDKSTVRSNISGVNSSRISNSIPTIEQIFWDGELRQTATQHAEPRKDGRPTFRLTEVLGKVRGQIVMIYFEERT